MKELTMTVAPIIDWGNGFYIELDKGRWPTEGLRVAIAAGSGSGKSYLTMVMLEELAGLGIPFLVIDPEGEYKALKKLAGADIVLVSEAGGDIPLTYPRPEWVDATIKAVERGAGVVVDFDDWDEADMRTAYLWLVEELWRVQNKHRKAGTLRAMVLVIEEAAIFAPQKWQNDMPSLLATVKVARRGRKRGINTIFITQRPYALEKDVLAEANLQIVGYLKLKEDFEKVEAFLQVGGARVKHADLLTLQKGHFYAALGPKVLRFPPVRTRRTPDLAATPVLRYRPQRSFAELSQPAERGE